MEKNYKRREFRIEKTIDKRASEKIMNEANLESKIYRIEAHWGTPERKLEDKEVWKKITDEKNLGSKKQLISERVK